MTSASVVMSSRATRRDGADRDWTASVVPMATEETAHDAWDSFSRAADCDLDLGQLDEQCGSSKFHVNCQLSSIGVVAVKVKKTFAISTVQKNLLELTCQLRHLPHPCRVADKWEICLKMQFGSFWISCHLHFVQEECRR